MKLKTLVSNTLILKMQRMQFNSETLEPLYKLVIDKVGESNALWISRKMGIEEGILKKGC